MLTARDAEFEASRLAADAEIAELRAMVHALSLQVEQLQRRLDSGSDDSGMPPSKEPIGVKARRKGRTGSPSGRARWLVAAAVR